MKVLVTGGAGYVGSVAVEQLIANQDEVVVLDNLCQGHVEAIHPDALFIEGDLADKRVIDTVLEQQKPDTIMHFASHALVGESMRRPFLYLRENIANGLNLIESAIEHDVNRFILSSTANLFGQPQKMPIDEHERIIPGSPYGESKQILERYLYWMAELYDFRYACLRYFNAAGATPRCGEDRDPETHIIPLVLDVALGKREKIVIYGNDYDTSDGTCVRDYIHVHDLATAHILAAQAIGERNVTYNLGTGRGYSVQEVVETARDVTGHPIPAEIGVRRPGDPDVLVASSQTISEELGWKPVYPHLREIIQTAWDWRKQHPNGY